MTKKKRKQRTKKLSRINKKNIEKAVEIMLKAIGEDLNRIGLKDTPRRVADMYEEIFAGVNQDPKKELKTYRTKNEDEMIIIKNIPFYSICEHHLLPFFGKAHVVYIPKHNKITGFSTLVRVIDVMAKKPLLQERLTHEIADFLMINLKPMGVLVVIEAEHLCLSMIGVKKPGTLTVTSAIRGVMRSAATRAEALSLIKGK
jgi:GTP cyclohydrolase I